MPVVRLPQLRHLRTQAQRPYRPSVKKVQDWIGGRGQAVGGAGQGAEFGDGGEPLGDRNLDMRRVIQADSARIVRRAYVKAVRFLNELGYDAQFPRNGPPNIGYTTGFTKAQILDLCVGVRAACSDDGTIKWPPGPGIMEFDRGDLGLSTQESCAGRDR